MTDTEQLRSLLGEFAAELGKEFPKQMLARAFVATGCDVSLADVGPMATMWLTEGATSLLAGHWTPETIQTYITSER